MALQHLVSFLNRKKKQKQPANASIIKMGLSGDLLGSFRSTATIEATEAAVSVKVFQGLSKLKS